MVIADCAISNSDSSHKKLLDCGLAALGVKDIFQTVVVDGVITKAVAKKLAKSVVKQVAKKALPLIGTALMIAEFVYCLASD